MKVYLKTIGSLLAVVLAVVSCSVDIRAAISYTYSISESDLNIYDVTAPDGTVFSRISGNDMFGSGEVGQPEIPYKVIRLLVPDNAYDFSVSIEEASDSKVLQLEHTVFPNQKAIPINDYCDDMFTYSDEDSYRRISSSFKAEVLEESRLEGRYHIVSVGLWPLVYSGTPDRLEICESMRIRLDYRESRILKQTSAGPNHVSFINIADIVVNADAVQSDPALASDFIFNPDLGLGPLPRYYIISERKLLPALEDLATWKTQKGYNVVMKAIEDIYEDSAYKVGTNGIVDEAASLRKYLQDEYAEYGTFFCFLVGDHRTRMPIRKVAIFQSSTLQKDPNGDSYIPTDNYFSDLSDNGWTLRKDANNMYVGSIFNCGYVPYIYVGRLLCHSSEEIFNYINKLLIYESNPGRGNTQYLSEAMIFVQHAGRSSYQDTLNEMSSIFDSVECLLDSKMSNENAESYPTGEEIIKKMSLTGYNSLMGHGEPGTIACSGRNNKSYEWDYIKALNSYKHDPDSTKSQTNLSKPCYNNGLDLLTNSDFPSVIYTKSCTTMPFDIYRDGWRDIFDLPHTMASSYTVGGSYGGVAYLGNTRSGYWTESADLEIKFLKQLQHNAKIGIVESLSKYISTGYIYTGRSSDIRQAHNLVGDPEFELWTKQPSQLNAIVTWNSSNISVSGDDAIGSIVVINDGNGNLRRLDVSGNLQPPTGFQDGGKMEACGIYKTGYLPIVKLDCYSDELENCRKKFVVRSSVIGNVESRSVVIGSEAKVDIRAVDSIDTGEGLNITNNGELTLRCDKNITMSGSKVDTGGSMQAHGEKVILSGGFTVEAGGTLNINN